MTNRLLEKLSKSTIVAEIDYSRRNKRLYNVKYTTVAVFGDYFQRQARANWQLQLPKRRLSIVAENGNNLSPILANIKSVNIVAENGDHSCQCA